MKITKEQLKEWSACSSGFNWFVEHFPTGEAEYQTVLNTLAEDNQPSYARWLMDKAGADDSVLEAENLTGENVFFAGSIQASGSIQVEFSLLAGGGIKAGHGIEAGRGINAGRGIKAGGGMGIFAGLRVKIEQWNLYAKVSAKAKPDNLISGFWVGE